MHLLYCSESVILEGMKAELLSVFKDLDTWIQTENEQRCENEESPFPKALVQIFGQCGLLLNSSVNLPLVGTRDLDARVESLSKVGSVWPIRKKLERLLEFHDLDLETDIHLIWIPEGSTFSVFFETTRLCCEVLDPLFLLCSKAIKAKEKNKVLLREAIQFYGDELRNLIEKYGGDCGYFEE